MWELLLNDDEQMIASSVREYLERELPLDRLRPQATRRDPGSTHAGMVDLGWTGLGLPESVGGSGLGLVEEMLLHRECGRYLVGPTLLATTLAAHVAYHADDLDFARMLVAGEATVAFGVLGATHSTTRLNSALAFDWNGTDPVLLWNDTGMGLFAASSFVAMEGQDCLDDSLTMHAGSIDLRVAQCWVPAQKSALPLRAHVLLAASLTGLAEHASEITIAYAKVRKQFGQPIGAFQAVKHRCADMGLRHRLSWYQTCLACLKLAANAPDSRLQVAAAKLLAAQAAHDNSRAAIQIHGGIGYQAECDVHWFMKRAHVYDQAGGAWREQARLTAAEPSPLW
jgi:alkylation response protein AidB-like acyl-CoA dehydrogenase